MYREILTSVNDNDIYLLDNTTSSSYEYWGYAQPGSTTAQPNWKITKWTKDGSGLYVQKQFASGSPAYAFIWDSRDTYSYS